MLPSNTVPITAEELKQLISKETDVIVFEDLFDKWSPTMSFESKDYLNTLLEKSVAKFCIAAHDYRHYFGEVVDLATKVSDGYLTYLGSDFKYGNDYDELTYCIREVSTSLTQFEGTEAECKQWLIDHFTAIAAKDLPNVNLKFIFS